jgi:hypothetical protein
MKNQRQPWLTMMKRTALTPECCCYILLLPSSFCVVSLLLGMQKHPHSIPFSFFPSCENKTLSRAQPSWQPEPLSKHIHLVVYNLAACSAVKPTIDLV